MGNIERRWIVGTGDPGNFHLANDQETADFFASAGKPVSGPWVPEADWRGAVEVLRDLVQALDNVVNPGDAGEPLDRAEAYLREHGGQ